MIPPEDEVEVQSIPIPSIPGPSARFGNNHLHSSRRLSAQSAPSRDKSGGSSKHNNSTRDHKPTSSNYCSDRTKKLQNIKFLGSHDTRLSCETAPSPLGTKRPRKPSDKEEDREEATTSTAIDTNGQCRQHEPDLDKEKTPEIDQAENTGESISTPRGRSYPTRRSNQKCLLVHDDFFNEFDEAKFSGRFEISTYRAFTAISFRKEASYQKCETQNQISCSCIQGFKIYSGIKLLPTIFLVNINRWSTISLNRQRLNSAYQRSSQSLATLV